MKQIPHEFYSHLDLIRFRKGTKSFKKVALSDGHLITTYKSLLLTLAEIQYFNPRLDLFYRGQHDDYRIKPDGWSSIFPKIFRDLENPGKTVHHAVWNKRYKVLDGLLEKVKNADLFKVDPNLRLFNEVGMSILQHYGVFTPMIDLTSSPHIAAFFATQGNENEFGYFYVFGMPRQHSAIAYHPEDRIVCVRLSSVVPPIAKRAHFQSAFYAGRLSEQRGKRDANLSKRMVAKFKIPANEFYNGGYSEFPKVELFPEDDLVAKYINQISQYNE